MKDTGSSEEQRMWWQMIGQRNAQASNHYALGLVMYEYVN